MRAPIAPAACVLGAGASTLVLRPPRWLVRAVARRFANMLFLVDTEEPVVALTLDDGPHPLVTPLVLDALSASGCRATFFMHGSAAGRWGEIVGRAVEEGHELGNHLWEDRPAVRLSREEFESQLLRTHAVLAEHGPVGLLRPPSGLIRRDQLEVLAEHGYRCALGSVYPYDAHLPAGRYLAHDVLRRARPGSIVILHEGRPERSSVVGILDVLLPGLRARGFEVTTVTELLALRRDPCGPLG